MRFTREIHRARAPVRVRIRVCARAIVLALAGASLAIGTTVGAPHASAELRAVMSAGAAFVAAGDVDRIAGDLNFNSLSPGLDGGIAFQFGGIDRGWSGAFGLDAFWSRRRLDGVYFPDDSGPVANNRSSFTVTAAGFPVSTIYSLPRMGGRLSVGAGAGYYVATVRAKTNLGGSNVFPNDGAASEGERSADGLGLHATLAYERATRVGGIGGGILMRLARLHSDEVRGSSDFDVDLSGVSVFLSFSVRQAQK